MDEPDYLQITRFHLESDRAVQFQEEKHIAQYVLVDHASQRDELGKISVVSHLLQAHYFLRPLREMVCALVHVVRVKTVVHELL